MGEENWLIRFTPVVAAKKNCKSHVAQCVHSSKDLASFLASLQSEKNGAEDFKVRISDSVLILFL